VFHYEHLFALPIYHLDRDRRALFGFSAIDIINQKNIKLS